MKCRDKIYPTFDLFFYVFFKLLSKDGFVIKDMYEDLGVSKNTPSRYLSYIRNILYDHFGDDVTIVYDKKLRAFFLVCFRGAPNVINFFNMDHSIWKRNLIYVFFFTKKINHFGKLSIDILMKI